jgi:lysozyme family protein
MNEYPETFLRAIHFVMRFEGGLSDDPKDRGGLTKFGISQRAYPDLDIRSLTEPEAFGIYFRDYWMAMRCHQLPSPVDMAMLDTGVNCGTSRAAKWLQMGVNNGNSFLIVDGQIGPKTILAVTGISSYRLAMRILGHRLQHYLTIVSRSPDQSRFLRGWLRRVQELMLAL